MRYLRHRFVDRQLVLQAPVVRLRTAAGREAVLVLTAHLADRTYFERLKAIVEAEGKTVFYESVRPVDESDEHWQEPYHRFLRDLRRGVYDAIASLGLLAYQGDYLGPEPGWRHADVTCCELAAKLREEHVSIGNYSHALALLRKLIADARNDERARMLVTRALKWGLLAVSVTAVFQVMQLVPRNRAFYAVLNDWRSKRAVRQVLADTEGDFVLIYGAAHGETLVEALEEAGFRERGRSWLKVFAA